MSAADRAKWDARYAAGAYQARLHPSAFLAECESLLPAPGRALDLACGTGRNAIFLAERGWSVDAVDISPVALRRAAGHAEGLPIRWFEHDLEAGGAFSGGRSQACGARGGAHRMENAPGHYDLIVNVRYVNLPLLRRLPARLHPGQMLLVEQHLALPESPPVALSGPRSPAFRVAAGRLRCLAHGLRVVRSYEGLVREPDGTTAAVSRLLAAAPRLQSPAADL